MVRPMLERLKETEWEKEQRRRAAGEIIPVIGSALVIDEDMVMASEDPEGRQSGTASDSKTKQRAKK